MTWQDHSMAPGSTGCKTRFKLQDLYHTHRIHVCYIWQHWPSTKTPNVSIYTIHGSYGIGNWDGKSFCSRTHQNHCQLQRGFVPPLAWTVWVIFRNTSNNNVLLLKIGLGRFGIPSIIIYLLYLGVVWNPSINQPRIWKGHLWPRMSLPTFSFTWTCVSNEGAGPSCIMLEFILSSILEFINTHTTCFFCNTTLGWSPLRINICDRPIKQQRVQSSSSLWL